MQGSTNAVVFDNTVYVEGYVRSSTATHGIDVGVNSSAVSGATIDSNKVSRIRNNDGQTWSAYGINLGGGNNHMVQNNFVFDIRNDQTAGTGAFGTTFGAYGIRVASGTGHKVYFNSVHLFGVLPGMVNTDLTAAFMIVGTGQTGMDVRNNLFSNQLTGGNPAAANTRHTVVYLPSGGTSAMNLTWNNNGYYQGPATTGALSLLAQVGTTAGTGQYFAADFDPGSTGNPLNLRTYTSTLSVAGTNDNASFALAIAPPVVSDTDLHIPPGTITQLAHGAAPGHRCYSTILTASCAMPLHPTLVLTSSAVRGLRHQLLPQRQPRRRRLLLRRRRHLLQRLHQLRLLPRQPLLHLRRRRRLRQRRHLLRRACCWSRILRLTLSWLLIRKPAI